MLETNQNLDLKKVNAVKDTGDYKNLTMLDIITNMDEKHQDIFAIREGVLVYIGEKGTQEGKWCEELETQNTVPPVIDTIPTIPTAINIQNITADSITVQAEGSTSKLGIQGYQYSLDGENWVPTEPTTNPHICEGILEETTYIIYARAVNKNDKYSEKISCKHKFIDYTKYGTSIQNSYPSLYTSATGSNIVQKDSAMYEVYYDGNFAFPMTLINSIGSYQTILSTCLSNGSNILDVAGKTHSSRWTSIGLSHFEQTNVSISDVFLVFDNDKTCTIQQAVEEQYICPLVICSSAASNQNYVYGGVLNLLTGNATSMTGGTTGGGGILFFIKVLDIPLKEVHVTTNKASVAKPLGMSTIKEYDANCDISLVPVNK